MIYVKVETQSRERGKKTHYISGSAWPAIFAKMHQRALHNPHKWHTVKLHTVSENEYRRHTHPQLDV